MRKGLVISALLFQVACSTSPTQTSSHDSQPIQDISAKPRNQNDIEAEAKTDPGDCKHTATEFHCLAYVKNYDADTITLDLPGIHPYFGHHAQVRLLGIDTPEMKGATECEKAKAREAQQFVQQVLQTAKRIDLVDLGKEKFGRILARLIYDGRDLNELLVKKGFAYRYFGERKVQRDWCRPLQ